LSSVVKREHIEYKGISTKKSDYLGLIAKGFFLNVINIGVLIFWLGSMVIAGHQLHFEPVSTTVYFGTVITTYLIIDLIKIALAKEFKKKLTDELLNKVKKYIGLILMFFGIILSMKALISGEEIIALVKNIF